MNGFLVGCINIVPEKCWEFWTIMKTLGTFKKYRHFRKFVLKIKCIWNTLLLTFIRNMKTHFRSSIYSNQVHIFSCTLIFITIHFNIKIVFLLFSKPTVPQNYQCYARYSQFKQNYHWTTLLFQTLKWLYF